MGKKLEIDYSFGYIFDKSKLVVMYPVGSNVIEEEEYETEVEVAFLEDGINTAFEAEDINQANEFVKPLEMFLTKPNKILPFVTAIKDYESKKELNNLLYEFDEEYETKNKYLKKGYEFKDVYHVYENIINFIPKENLSVLNILKIEQDKFDMDSFIKKTKNNLEEVVDSNLISIKMSKSTITERLFIKEDGINTCNYVLFAIKDSYNSDEIICANKDRIKENSIDIGDIEINNIRDCGYIIEEVEGYLTFKVVNYISETSNKKQVAQVVDYSGELKLKMIEFLKLFIK